MDTFDDNLIMTHVNILYDMTCVFEYLSSIVTGHMVLFGFGFWKS